MGLNETASAERIHIGFFGRRNAGKSSLVNAVTGQELAVVSDVKGTTTDPVKKAMELLPLGPVVIIDTPGFDDEGELGELRIKKTRQAMGYTDIAILVINAAEGISQTDENLIAAFEKKHIPYIVAYNKADLLDKLPAAENNTIYVSARDKTNINELKELIGRLSNKQENDKKLLADIIKPGDTALLVIPIDSAAPKGRIILPQQQTLRELLDIGATAVACRDSELFKTLEKLKEYPSLVITDSQVFGGVSKILPEEVSLTSFSILFARYKGNLESLVRGAAQIDKLQDGDKVLISEGCTHHRQCDDIGSVKIPAWLTSYTGKKLDFVLSSGTEFPEDLSGYGLVIHCGGCMLNAREMNSRISYAADEEIPMTNYGIAIAHMNGILKRSLAPFPELCKVLEL